jgi:hypothetical protein
MTYMVVAIELSTQGIDSKSLKYQAPIRPLSGGGVESGTLDNPRILSPALMESVAGQANGKGTMCLLSAMVKADSALTAGVCHVSHCG